jgi:valyl-tRNA synthetase
LFYYAFFHGGKALMLKKYARDQREEHWRQVWEEEGTYRFDPDSASPLFSIDTPPPTVSGRLHMGHVYSYCHADFIARYQRMRGCEVFYPMGFDDNGLPTEHLIEQSDGVSAVSMDPDVLVAECLRRGAEAQEEYRRLWQSLGLSIDWEYSYRTIGPRAQRLAQEAFIDLWQRGLIYRREAPTLWCPHCQTAIAQAELEDEQRDAVLYEVGLNLVGGGELRIATTRPELMPACQAVFVHPEDSRYAGLHGRQVRLPLFDLEVPILADQQAEPDKGTGAVMCCTFGDQTDIYWWRRHHLPLVSVLERDGCLAAPAGPYAGLDPVEGREKIVADLAKEGVLCGRSEGPQTVRTHERCSTPVEIAVTPQFFVRVLDFKEDLLRAGEQIDWRPASMRRRYRQWVENLKWDWCISRQRPYGVPLPLWHCDVCGAVHLAQIDHMPVDPKIESVAGRCKCGGDWRGERDVMDTWMTSSLTPQIAAAPQAPMDIRPLAHDIIRTWAFYSIVMAHHRWGRVPWKSLVVSGWGLSPKGKTKISKSRGGGGLPPVRAVERYAADAVRYWAACTGLGKDALISTERMQAGGKLLTKMWNLARFSTGFLNGYTPPSAVPRLSGADAWILARLQRVVAVATRHFDQSDYAAARSQIESFFWHDLADNYCEMAKKRLYGPDTALRPGALYALQAALGGFIRLWAPFMPFVTEEIYRLLFATAAVSPQSHGSSSPSVHRAAWPIVDADLDREDALDLGQDLLQAASLTRRFKSAKGWSVGTELAVVRLWYADGKDPGRLALAVDDIASLTRARQVLLGGEASTAEEELAGEGGLYLGFVAAQDPA